MDDLIERLRELTMREICRDGYCREEPVPINRDGPEAADELTALRERVAELEGVITGLRLDFETMPFGNKGGWLVRWHKDVLAKVDAILAKQGGEDV